MESKTFPVIEIFGPTIQGEGAVAGRVTHFVRMGGCDYRCRWCDSGFAVLPKAVRENAEKLTAEDIFQRVFNLPGKPDWVTISGGNPALHQLDLLVDHLHLVKFKVAVETQGSLWKDWLVKVDQLTISPKPPSASTGDPTDLANFVGKLMYHNRDQLNACLKVPVFDRTDFDWAANLHHAYPEFPFYLSVVTRMGGLDGSFDKGHIDTLEEVARRFRQVAEWTAASPYMGDVAVFPQLHVIAWGHKRGV